MAPLIESETIHFYQKVWSKMNKADTLIMVNPEHDISAWYLRLPKFRKMWLTIQKSVFFLSVDLKSVIFEMVDKFKNVLIVTLKVDLWFRRFWLAREWDELGLSLSWFSL